MDNNYNQNTQGQQYYQAPIDNGDEYGWDSEISAEAGAFVVLPEGDYDFVVTNLQRDRYQPNPERTGKLPPCPMAIVTHRFTSEKGEQVIIDNRLFLHKSTEGLLAAFFEGIGQKKKGEALKPDWNTVIGATGRAKIGVRKWTSQNNNEMESNEIKKYFPKEQASTPTTQGGWKAGGY